MAPEILSIIKDYGIVAGLFALGIVEFFRYLKDQQTSKTLQQSDIDKKTGTDDVVKELKLQNENHLEHLQVGVNDGFRNMMECQQRQTDRICAKLDMVIMAMGELKGK